MLRRDPAPVTGALNGSGGVDNGTDVITEGAAGTGEVVGPVTDTTTLSIRLREGANASDFRVSERSAVAWSPSVNLDFSRPIDLVVYGSTSAPLVTLGQIDVRQGINDADGDGLCDQIDACVGPDGPDRDGDGVGANCDCNDGDARAYPRAAEVCDAVAQSCGAPDERVYLDVDGDGLLHSLARGDATNPSGAAFVDGSPLELTGDRFAVQYRLPLEGFDPSEPFEIRITGRFGQPRFGYGFPTIALSDGQSANIFRFLELPFSSRIPRSTAATVIGQDHGDRLEYLPSGWQWRGPASCCRGRGMGSARPRGRRPTGS